MNTCIRVGALAFAVAVASPALWAQDAGAAKIKIGGEYRVVATGTNTGHHPGALGKDPPSAEFVTQRFYTNVDVTTAANVQAHMQLEIGNILWGSGGDFGKTYDPGDGDKVGMELRRGYLSYSHDSYGSFDFGIQGFTDKFMGTLADSGYDFSVGGITWHSPGNWGMKELSMRVGAYMLMDANTRATSDDSKLLTFDLDYTSNANLSLGMSVYHMMDKGGYSYGLFGGPGAAHQEASDTWVGGRMMYKMDKLSVDAMAIYNTGETETVDWEHSGYALGARAKYKLDTGTFGVQGFYSTGNDGSDPSESDEFRTVAQGRGDNMGAQGYWSFLSVSSPRSTSDDVDLGIGLQNGGLGLLTIQAMYEHDISNTMKLYAAGGYLATAEDNAAGDSDLGMEVMAELGMNLGGGLTVTPGVGFFFPGDAYSVAGVDADTVQKIYVHAELKF